MSGHRSLGPFGCLCQTLAVKLTGDGCEMCQPDTSGSWHRKECPFFEFDGEPSIMDHCLCPGDERTTQRRDGKDRRLWARRFVYRPAEDERRKTASDRRIRRIRDRRKGGA